MLRWLPGNRVLTHTATRSSAAALAVVLLAAAVMGAYRLHHDARIWTSDSAIYLRMTLEDRGLSRERAKTAADAFMRDTPEGRNPEAAGFYTPHPPEYYAEQYGLFTSRPLYPRLGAVLYGRFGPRGLQVISAVAYVAASVLVCAVLMLFVRPWIAALGALAFATAPHVLSLAALPLTDELALLFWVAALGALLWDVRRPSPAVLAGVLVASLLLTFTRPAAYLPFAAACGLTLAVWREPARRRAALAAVGTTALAVVAFLAYSAAMHGPGLATQLRWQYAWQHVVHGPYADGSFAHWYLLALAAAAGVLLTVGVYRYAALLPVVLAAYGATATRRDDLGVLLGAAAGTLVAIVANPLEVNRTVLLPLTPVLIVFATIALGRLFAVSSVAVSEMMERP